MLWQLADAGIFSLDKLCADFTNQDFKKIIKKFKKEKRNFGSI